MTEVMTQLRTEGEKAFPVEIKENDNSSAPSAGEETGNDQTGSSGQDDKQTKEKAGDTENFAEHPRWKEREDDWKSRYNEQEKRHIDEMTKMRQELDTRFSELTKKTSDHSTTVPEWWGGDEKTWQSFLEWNQSLLSKAKEEARSEALKEIDTRSASEKKAIDDATAYFQEQVSTLESDKTVNPDGVKIDRNKLLKFVLDNDLVDSKGRWNYRAGYLIMKGGAQSSANDNKDRKDLASATTSERRGESKPSSVTTTADFKKPENRPW